MTNIRYCTPFGNIWRHSHFLTCIAWIRFQWSYCGHNSISTRWSIPTSQYILVKRYYLKLCSLSMYVFSACRLAARYWGRQGGTQGFSRNHLAELAARWRWITSFNERCFCLKMIKDSWLFNNIFAIVRNCYWPICKLDEAMRKLCCSSFSLSHSSLTRPLSYKTLTFPHTISRFWDQLALIGVLYATEVRE